ncbi:HAD family hydrolase [Tyzzerella sp. OttesenSCG-928-J15]|nr:HAD family hydrolase [Tyzzerella sp. OttesenSCG-928-J15]
MSHPKAILFDLDDTLISFDGVTHEAWTTACRDFVEKYRPDCEEEEIFQAVTKTSAWYWSDPDRHTEGRKDLLTGRRNIVRLALAELNIHNEEQVESLARGYSEIKYSLIHIYPESIPLLNKLKEAGVRLGLLTNGTSEEQRDKIRRFALEDYFEIILIEGEFGCGKPDSRVYRKALELLELESSDVWMVGDNLVWDIGGAQSLGIHAIWHDYKGKGLPEGSQIIPDRIINNISQL